MYESFFGLGKRPFAATPDPACFIPIDRTYNAYSTLVQCLNEGRGIGVLTAPAGLGKSLVCQRVAQDLEGRFSVVLLPTANFLTRRSLLQAILFELGFSFIRMGDQELRLELTAALRRVRPSRRGIVLIVDEAHLLAPRMLEELRTLLNIAENGEPLVRLLVSGQLGMEETLSQPGLDAFNQRIGSQVILEPFSRNESTEYVSRRLAWAGGNVSDILSRDALAAICEASDGSPRCLNHLCDHSLLLARQTSERPVSVGTVHTALDELKRLPLIWNDPFSRRRPATDEPLDAVRGFDISEPLSVDGLDEGEPAKRTTIESRSVPETVSRYGESIELKGAERSAEAFVAKTLPQQYDPVEVDEAVEFQDAFDLDDLLDSVGPYDTVELPRTDPSRNVLELSGSLESQTSIERGQGGQSEESSIASVAFDIAPALHSATFALPRVASLPQRQESQGALDEEVVVDRYAALDAAVNRLARTMICARAVSRHRDSIAAAGSNKDASRVVEQDAPEAEGFDVVLPEESRRNDVVESTALEPQRQRAVAKMSAGGRRYEFLFSELRRRRRGA